MPSPLLHHQLDGSGPRIALLHPVGLDRTFFNPLVSELRADYRILRMDVPGHGGTPVSESVLSLSDYAHDIHRLLESLEFTPSTVMGFSFGGMLAQVLAIEHPGDVNALVLAACPSRLPDDGRDVMKGRGALAEREGMQAVTEATLQRWFTRPFRDAGLDASARARLLSGNVRGWAEAWRAMSEINTWPKLSGIQIPTLCLAGELDVSAPPEIVAEIASEIPGAQFQVLSGASHMLFIEQPKEVAAAIRGFLASIQYETN
jgi:3-oxoadipate enol-lactonase